MTTLTGYHFIAGARSRDGAIAFASQNPATGERQAPECAEPSSAEIERSFDAAHAAFPALEAADGLRAALLERIANNIEGLGDELLERATLETALPRARLESERARTLHQLRLFADLIRDSRHREPRTDPADAERRPPKPALRRMLRGVGPVVVFGASNFPLAFSVAGGDTASALAAGCPVIVKGHPHHLGTAELTAGAVTSATTSLGLPAGSFSLLQSAAPATALSLVRHPHARAVGFTGSQRVGRSLFDAANQRPDPIPVFAEMGSVNPVFLLPLALESRADEIAAGLHASATASVGQFCTNPGLVFLLGGGATERFLKAFAAKILSTPGATFLHAGIKDGYVTGSDAIRAIEGVELLASGAVPTGPCGAQARAWLTTAAVYEQQTRLHEEVFGPSTVIVVCDDRATLLRQASRLAGQLTASIHAGAGEACDDLLAILQDKVGRLIFGGYPTGVEVSSAMQHGGPYPASTDVRFGAVGPAAIQRFLRPICYQNFPDDLLPQALR